MKMDTNQTTVTGKGVLIWPDYISLAVTLIIPFCISIYYSVANGGQNTALKYIQGNRQLSIIPVAASATMTVVSTTTILGITSEVYFYGCQYFAFTLSLMLGSCISAFVFVPMMYKLNIVTAFQYIQRRYKNRFLTQLCLFSTMMTIMFLAAISLYAPAISLQTAIGFPLWLTILCTGVICIIYTSLGGIQAVVWTDLLQLIIFIAGMFAIITLGCIKAGGIYNVYQSAKDAGRMQFLDINQNPTKRVSFLSGFLYGFFYGLTYCGSESTLIQRYSSLPSISSAIKMIMMNQLSFLFIYSLIFCMGLVMFTQYDIEGCDPYRSYAISSKNQIFPYYVVNSLKIPGLAGVMIAVFYSGALSTLSSCSNIIAATLYKEFIVNIPVAFPEQRKTIVLKLLAFVIGVIIMLFAFIIEFLPGHVSQLALTLMGAFFSPTCAVIFVGALIPWVRARAAIAAIIASLIIGIWLTVGQFLNYSHLATLPTKVNNCSISDNATFIPIMQDRHDVFWLYRLSFQHFGFISLILTSIIAISLSLCCGNKTYAERDTIIDLKCPCSAGRDISLHREEVELKAFL